MHSYTHALSNNSVFFFFSLSFNLNLCNKRTQEHVQLKISLIVVSRLMKVQSQQQRIWILEEELFQNVWGANLWLSVNEYSSWWTSNSWRHKLGRAELAGCSAMDIHKQSYLQRILIRTGHGRGMGGEAWPTQEEVATWRCLTVVPDVLCRENLRNWRNEKTKLDFL